MLQIARFTTVPPTRRDLATAEPSKAGDNPALHCLVIRSVERARPQKTVSGFRHAADAVNAKQLPVFLFTGSACPFGLVCTKQHVVVCAQTKTVRFNRPQAGGIVDDESPALINGAFDHVEHGSTLSRLDVTGLDQSHIRAILTLQPMPCPAPSHSCAGLETSEGSGCRQALLTLRRFRVPQLSCPRVVGESSACATGCGASTAVRKYHNDFRGITVLPVGRSLFRFGSLIHQTLTNLSEARNAAPQTIRSRGAGSI
jgi:hypothetical protein